MQEFLHKLGVDLNVAFYLIFLGLVWTRALAMASMLPFLFGKPVPRYVVVGASMVLALFVYPHLLPQPIPALPDDMLFLFMLYLKEAFFGLIMGLSVGAIFYGFQAVGAMIDNQRGMSIARILIPQLGEQGSITGNFLFQFSIVLYLAIGGHHLFFDAFFRSYWSLPVLAFPHPGEGMLELIDLFIRITGEVIYVSFQLAAPVIIAIFLADLILGIANRIAPQINVWELGFNVKGYVGILLLFVSLAMVADQMERYSLKANDYVGEAVKHLQGIPKSEIKERLPAEEGMRSPEGGLPPVVSPP